MTDQKDIKTHELISRLRAKLNGIISPNTSKTEKIQWGWDALELLKIIEMGLTNCRPEPSPTARDTEDLACRIRDTDSDGCHLMDLDEAAQLIESALQREREETEGRCADRIRKSNLVYLDDSDGCTVGITVISVEDAIEIILNKGAKI